MRLRPDADGADPLGQVRHDLETNLALTGTQATSGQQLITGFLPIQSILTLSSVTNFGAVTPVYAPELSTGVVTSQGVSVIGAVTFSWPEPATSEPASRNLFFLGCSRIPSQPNRFRRRCGGRQGRRPVATQRRAPAAGVQIFQDGTNHSTDEGRGVLEIVHDVAPRGSLAFNTAEGGPQALPEAYKLSPRRVTPMSSLMTFSIPTNRFSTMVCLPKPWIKCPLIRM